MSNVGGSVPSVLLGDIGKSRLASIRRAAILERLDDQEWTSIARFATVNDANKALDEVVAGGIDLDHLRVTEAGPSRSARVVMIGGLVAGVLICGFFVFIVLSVMLGS